MATKADLENWVHDALKKIGGEGSVTQIAKVIWQEHEQELRQSGDLFFTWQYDMRWAGQRLQKSGHLKKNARSWSLTK